MQAKENIHERYQQYQNDPMHAFFTDRIMHLLERVEIPGLKYPDNVKDIIIPNPKGSLLIQELNIAYKNYFDSKYPDLFLPIPINI